MKHLLLLLFTFLLCEESYSQKYFTRNGSMRFYSHAPIEDIAAISKQANFIVDSKTGDVAVKVLMRSFEFPKALMQEHFNENYIESHKFPTAEFRGKIANIEQVDFSKDGAYPVILEGLMTIHGVSKKFKEAGTLTVKGKEISSELKFDISLPEYQIKNDRVKNISNVIEVTVKAALEPLKQ